MNEEQSGSDSSSGVEYGVRVSQVRPSNCFKHLEEISFTIPFLTQIFLIFDDVKLIELSNNSFERKNMTF